MYAIGIGLASWLLLRCRTFGTTPTTVSHFAWFAPGVSSLRRICLTDGILALEVHGDQALIDDDVLLARLAVCVGEHPPLHRFHSDCVEIPGPDAEHRHIRGALAGALARPSISS